MDPRRPRFPTRAVALAVALLCAAPALTAPRPKRPPAPPKAGVWQAELPLGYVRFELKRTRPARIVGVERFHSCKSGVVDVVGRGASGISKRRFRSRSGGVSGRFLTGGTALLEFSDPCSRQTIRAIAHRVGRPARVLRGVYTGVDASSAPVQLRVWDPSSAAAGEGRDCGRGQRLCRVEVTLGPIACAPGLAPLARRLPVGPVGADGRIRLVGQGISGAAPTTLLARVGAASVSGSVTVAGACGELVVPFTAALVGAGQAAAAAAAPGG